MRSRRVHQQIPDAIRRRVERIGAEDIHGPVRQCSRAVSVERVQVYCEVREIGQGPGRQKIVHERQRGLKSARQRRVVGGAEERIQPDQPMTASLEPRDLRAELHRVAAVPAVRDQQHDRTAVHHPAAPLLMELPIAAPIRVPPDQSGTARDTAATASIGTAGAELSRDPGELR